MHKMPDTLSKSLIRSGAIDESADLSITWSYINRTGVPIFVQDRHGVNFDMSPLTGHQMGPQREFVVRKMYVWKDSKVKIDARGLLSEMEHLSTQKQIKEQLADLIPDMQGYYRLAIDFVYLHSDLKHNPVRYIPELDILIGLGGLPSYNPHPYSPMGIYYKTIIDNDTDAPAASWSGYIVDNSGVFGSRYVNVFGVIFELKVRKSQHESDGLYMVRSNYHDGDDRVITPRITRLSLKEVDDCEYIFKSFEAANGVGDISSQRAAIVSELEHERKVYELQARKELAEVTKELERLKVETSIKKSLLEKDQAYDGFVVSKMTSDVKFDHEVKSNSEKLRHQRTKNQYESDSLSVKSEYEQKSMANKSEYEERSLSRKDASEFMKWGVPIATAVVGIGVQTGVDYYTKREKDKSG